MTPDELMTAIETARRRKQAYSNRTAMIRAHYSWGRVCREIGIGRSTLNLIKQRKYVGPDTVQKCQAWIDGAT